MGLYASFASQTVGDEVLGGADHRSPENGTSLVKNRHDKCLPSMHKVSGSTPGRLGYGGGRGGLLGSP